MSQHAPPRPSRLRLGACLLALVALAASACATPCREMTYRECRRTPECAALRTYHAHGGGSKPGRKERYVCTDRPE